MQICPECGTRNPAGAEFCSNCNAFLAWEDQQPSPRAPEPAPRGRPDAAPTPPPPPEPPPGPRRPPARHNSQKVHKLPPDPVEQDPAEQDDRTVVLPRLPDRTPGSGSRSSGPPPPPDGTDRVASPSKVRGPASVPPSRQPPSVPPGDAQAPPPRPAQHEPERSLAPGEVPCPRCGTGNSPDRHFCRRCALELRGAVAREAPPPPPPPRSGPSPLVWVLVVLAAIVILWLLITG